MRKCFSKYIEISQSTLESLQVGEFGINFKGSSDYGELQYLKDLLELFKEYRVDWHYWTYKAVAGSVFSDEILQCKKNPVWIRRGGSILG